jgi:acyl carrier protein
MTLEEFVEKFADEMTDTPAGTITAETHYKELEEWGSLASLSIISMIDEEFGHLLTGADLRARTTVKELYDYVVSL